MDLTELRNAAADLQPLLRIGKNGVTDAIVQEVRRQVENRGLIKIKLLKVLTAEGDRRRIAEDLAARTDALLVHVVGSMVTLAKKPDREHPVVANRRGSRSL